MAAASTQQSRRHNLMVIIEAAMVAYVSYASHLLIQLSLNIPPPETRLSLINSALLTLFVLISALSVGLYEFKLRESFRGIIRRIFVSVIIGYGVMELLSGLAIPEIRVNDYYLPVACGLVICVLVGFRYISGRLGILGLGKRNIVIVGAGQRASIIEKRMRREVDRMAFNLKGFIPIPGDDRENGVKDEKLIHVKVDEHFLQFLDDNDIVEVVVACDQRRGTLPVEVLFDCKVRGIEITDLLDFLEMETGQIAVNLVYPSWVVYSNGFSSQNYLKDSLNYGVNLFIAGLLLLVTWPFMLIAALLIYIEDGYRTGASALYTQERVGHNGKLFKIFKFRSMRPDAEKNGAQWANKGDSRVTRVGHYLRKYRIDELPQLWNVIKGEMVFIGPRPERPEFVEELITEIPYYNQRHNVKPGLTGWAQLNYPYGASINDSLEKLKFDLYYVKHHSFLLDLLILIRTVEVILFGKGR